MFDNIEENDKIIQLIQFQRTEVFPEEAYRVIAFYLRNVRMNIKTIDLYRKPFATKHIKQQEG